MAILEQVDGLCQALGFPVFTQALDVFRVVDKVQYCADFGESR